MEEYERRVGVCNEEGMACKERESVDIIDYGGISINLVNLIMSSSQLHLLTLIDNAGASIISNHKRCNYLQLK